MLQMAWFQQLHGAGYSCLCTGPGLIFSVQPPSATFSLCTATHVVTYRATAYFPQAEFHLPRRCCVGEVPALTGCTFSWSKNEGFHSILPLCQSARKWVSRSRHAISRPHEAVTAQPRTQGGQRPCRKSDSRLGKKKKSRLACSRYRRMSAGLSVRASDYGEDPVLPV